MRFVTINLIAHKVQNTCCKTENYAHDCQLDIYALLNKLVCVIVGQHHNTGNLDNSLALLPIGCGAKRRLAF